jgi:DNA-binding NarL/FixJ family response regulator
MPYLRIAVFSLGEYPEYMEPYFITGGAQSYITLRNGIAEFYQGLRVILEGSAYIAKTVRKRLGEMKEDTAARPKKSQREKEVMVMLSDGATGKEICETLKISMSTVNHHKGNLFARYHVRNTMQLVKVALSLGKLEVEGFMEVVHGGTEQGRGGCDTERGGAARLSAGGAGDGAGGRRRKGGKGRA